MVGVLVAVRVGVLVGVFVAVLVGVFVDVLVGVFVAVLVGVLVDVLVAVAVAWLSVKTHTTSSPVPSAIPLIGLLPVPTGLPNWSTHAEDARLHPIGTLSLTEYVPGGNGNR